MGRAKVLASDRYSRSLSQLGGGGDSLAKLGDTSTRSVNDDPLGTQSYFDQQQPGSLSRNLFGSGGPNALEQPAIDAGQAHAAELSYRRFTPSLFLSPEYSPYISFGENGLASYGPPGQVPVSFDPSEFIPEDLRGIAGVGTSAQEYFDFVQQFEGGVIPPAVYADIVQTETNRQEAEAARQTAIGRIEGTAARAEDARLAFGEDPDRQLVTDLLQERATNPQFSEAERAAAQGALSRASAIADATARAEAGGRGVASGGLQSSRNAGLTTATAAAGIGLDARFNALNREAMDRATDLLGKYETAEDQLELAYLHEQTAIDGVLAALEADVNLAQIDYLAFEALEFGKKVFAANEAYRQASLEAFERSQEYDWPSVVDDFIQFMSAGGLQLGFLQ